MGNFLAHLALIEDISEIQFLKQLRVQEQY